MFESEAFIQIAIISAVFFSLAILLVAFLIRGEEAAKFHEREAKFLEDFNKNELK